MTMFKCTACGMPIIGDHSCRPRVEPTPSIMNMPEPGHGQHAVYAKFLDAQEQWYRAIVRHEMAFQKGIRLEGYIASVHKAREQLVKVIFAEDGE